MFYKETNFQKTSIGKIPKDWEFVRLGNVITYKKGKSPKSLLEGKEGSVLPYLSAESLRRGFFTLWSKETNNLVKVSKDDILLIWDGFYCGDAFTGHEGILSSTMIKIDPNKEKLTNYFLFYVIKTHFKEINSKISGMYLKHVNKHLFDSLGIALPSLAEQKKITEVLSNVDDALNETREIIAKTEHLKQGLMHELLTMGKGHKEFRKTEIGRIPKEWEVVKIGSIGKVNTGKTPSTNNPLYWEGEIPFIAPGDIGDERYVEKATRYITKEGVKEANGLLPKESVIVVCIGSTIGKIAMVDRDSTTNQQINSIVCNKGITPRYVYYSLLYRAERLKSYSGVAAVPIIKKSLFEKFEIPLPPSIEEQEEIAKTLSAVDEKLETERVEKARLERIKQGSKG